MEPTETPRARIIGVLIYASLIFIPLAIVWTVSGSAIGGLAVGVLVLVVLLMTDWGGGRGLARRLRDRARDESAPYDEPPDRPLSRWQ